MSNKYTILHDYEQILMNLEDILGSGVTTNTQLSKLSYKIIGNNDYLGTFSADEMPKYIRNNQCFISNTNSSKSSESVGHWVSFIKLNGKLFYYDSFARPVSKLSKHWAKKRFGER